MDKPKRWQTRVWIGEMYDEPVAVYGESLADLVKAAGEWLRENKPIRIGNAHPSHELSQRVNYRYLEGASLPPREWYMHEEPSAGWYYVHGAENSASPKYLGDIDETTAHFLKEALIIEKGPDYVEVPLYKKGELDLSRVKTVQRVKETLEVNDLLQRGWQIISLEYEGEKTSGLYEDEVVKRRTVFVLGHSEENAF